MDGEVRLADLFAALSVATDLGMGQAPEKAIRSCLLATELARSFDLPEPQVRDVYYATMLHHLGCTASSHELVRTFGDDTAVLPIAERTDDSTARGAFTLLSQVGRGTGVRRPVHLARVVAGGPSAGTEVVRSTCEVGTRLAERLHLGEGVARALLDSSETWDGRSGAYRRGGDDIALAARFALVGTVAVIFDRLGGPELAIEVVHERAGGWLDPEVAERFCTVGVEALRRVADTDVWVEVLQAEPDPVRRVPASQVDALAQVFADMVDLKSTWTLGHSTAVAELASDAARLVGLDESVVRRAGLLHDLGRVAVSGAIWERPGSLTTAQWEQVHLHPYHTERILRRSTVLTPVATIAGMHHERADGSGYHHAAAGAGIPAEARLLAAADAFQAMTQPRPHRPALGAERAAAELEGEAAAGHLDVECVRAVLEAAGQQVTRHIDAWPGGLTDREVEVLRLLARGSTNRQIAAELVISPRTAEHHVQNIYGKIGASTRPAAAMFAMEHGLVR